MNSVMLGHGICKWPKCLLELEMVTGQLNEFNQLRSVKIRKLSKSASANRVSAVSYE